MTCDRHILITCYELTSIVYTNLKLPRYLPVPGTVVTPPSRAVVSYLPHCSIQLPNLQKNIMLFKKNENMNFILLPITLTGIKLISWNCLQSHTTIKLFQSTALVL